MTSGPTLPDGENTGAASERPARSRLSAETTAGPREAGAAGWA